MTREKEKSAAENAAALADREAQLQERELKLQLREEMANHDIPKELSDIITVTVKKASARLLSFWRNISGAGKRNKQRFCYRSTGTGRK